MMFTKPIEYWLILAGMVIYAFTRPDSLPFKRKAANVGISALLTAGMSSEFSLRIGGSENIAVIVIMGGGVLMLDAATSLLASIRKDPEFLKGIIKSRLGGRNE